MKNVKIHQYDDDEYEDDDCVELFDTPNVVELDQEDEEIEVLEETTDRSGDLGLDINCLNISPSIEITRTMADKQTTKKTVSYGQFGDEEEDYGENNEDYSDDDEGSDYDMDQEVQAPVEITLDSEPEEITLDGGEDDLDYDEHMDTAEEIEDRELEKLKEVDARLSNSDYVLQMVEDEDHGPEMLADFTAHSWFAQPKGWRPSSSGEVWSATVDQVKKHYRLVEVVIQEQFNDQEEFLATVIPRLELDNEGRSKVGLYRLAKAMWFKSLDPEIPVMTETLEDDEIYEENGEEEYDEYDEYDEPDDEVEENYEEYENVAEPAGKYFQEYEDPAEDGQEEEGEFIDYGNNYDEQVEYTDYYEDGIQYE